MTFTGNQTAVDVVFVFFLVILCVLPLSTLPLLYVNQDNQPIKARPLWIVVPKVIMLDIFGITVCCQRIYSHSFPCAATLILTDIVFLAITDLFMLRIWVVWYTFKSTKEKAAIFNLDINEFRKGRGDKHDPQSDKMPPQTDLKLMKRDSSLRHVSGTAGWYLRHKYLVSDRFLRILFVVAFVPMTVALLLVFVYSPNIVNETVDECDSRGIPILINIPYILVMAVLACIAAFKFVPVEDAFYIKNEFRLAGISGVITIPMWIVLRTFDFNETVFPVSSVVVTIGCLLQYCYISIYPLYYVKSENQTTEGILPAIIEAAETPSYLTVSNYKREEDDESVSETLEELLTDNEQTQLFIKHLEKEFCVENLMFYIEVEEFKERYPTYEIEDCVRNAVEIYDKFIDDDADLQVNLPYRMTSDIKEDIKDDNRIIMSFFDEAQTEIFRLMNKDSFRRFKRMRKKELALKQKK